MDPDAYRDEADLDFLGRRVHILELSREVSSTMPVYPGHIGVTFWDHLTHDQSRRAQRVPERAAFRGYAVRGLVASEHVSTHVDSVWHFNPDRPDLTIDKVPWDQLITPAAWIDLSAVQPRTGISARIVQKALVAADVTLHPGMTLLCYTGVSQFWPERPVEYLSQYPGFDRDASEWILDQGVVNLCTDAVSTDHPADPTYPNHQMHSERLVIHTEVVANINRIPMHDGFWVGFFPLRLVGGTGSPARAIAIWLIDRDA